MRKIAPALLALSLTLTACGSGDGGGGSSEGGPITIGMITSLTGNYKPLGTGDRRGAKLAVKQINASGGVNGRKLKLIIKNDNTNPDQSVVAFNELLGEEVPAVIGPPFSNSALAIIPLAQRNKMPYVSTSASQEQVKPVRDYAFMTAPTSRLVAERHLQRFQAQGVTQIAIAHDTQSSYAVNGYTAMKELAPQYGVEIVADENFETTTSDFSSVFTHIRGSGAEALMVWATGAPGVVSTKQFATSGLDMQLVMTGAECSTLYTEPAGEAAEGVILDCIAGVVGPYLPESKLKQVVSKMATAFEKQHGHYPPQFAFDGYSAVQVIAAAIKNAQSTDGEAIQAALEKLEKPVSSGTFEFTPKKHFGLSLEDIAIVEVKDGEFVPTEWSKKQLEKAFG